MKPCAIYYRILSYQAEALGLLNQFFDVVELGDPREDTTEIMREVEVLTAPFGFPVMAARMSAFPKLRAIISNTTGVPHIDVAAAAERGISVCALHDEQAFLDRITPTAEHTIGLMLAVWRRIPSAHAAVLGGQWNRIDWGAARMFSRMRLGIVGFGRLGLKVARIAEAMEMNVAYYNPNMPGSMESLEALASRSDILSLHAPATEQTRHLVSRTVLEALPRGAMVVNTARGELLDTDALLDLLENKHVSAAALDVLDGEYDPDFAKTLVGSRILAYARAHHNLILTPHIGGSTVDAWTETQCFVIHKAARALKLEVAP
jgi:phosphoglycerate dehydrogenase-like enzyme